MSNKESIDLSDEGTLIPLLKKGHEGAFGFLLKQYQSKLFGIAYGITSDREESLDIVQEVFLKVSQHIGAFRGESGLSTWIHRITINQCLNWQRRWKRRFGWRHQPLEDGKTDDNQELMPKDYSPEAIYEQKELEKMFRGGLKELPKEARAVFVLNEVEGLSYDEIAKVLKIKKGTVSSRLYYARKKLRQSLEKYMDVEEVNGKGQDL